MKWIIFEVFIRLVTVLLLFFMCCGVCGCVGLNSPARTEPAPLYIGGQYLNHWTAIEVLTILVRKLLLPVFAKLQLVVMEAILFFKLLSHMDISQQASQTEEWFSQTV